MGDAVSGFFDGIGEHHAAVPGRISGTLRFDLQDRKRREHWRITFAKGSISAARSDAPADCVVRTDRSTLEAIIEGRTNAMAALLRGAIEVEGRTFLLAVFRGLLAFPADVPATSVGGNSPRGRS